MTHLYGMFVAFSLTALLIAVFVSRLSESLRARERELMLAREREAANTRLAALTTLSAGAAHELGTPLGTIALVSKELDRRLSGADLPDEAADVQLIRAEVDRCRGILDRMAGRAGDTVGEAPTEVTIDELTRQLRERLHPDLAARVEVVGEATLRLPPTAFLQVLENLVRNGLDASEEGNVTVDATTPGLLQVRDEGPGMSPEVLARAGEPFFTTKEAGHGMGLGLYLARTVVEQLGGKLDLRSKQGEGTVASLELPA